MKKLLTSLIVFNSFAACFAQTYSRLIASSVYSNTASPTDSSFYIYSGDQPGKYNKYKNYADLKYDRVTSFRNINKYWLESLNNLQFFDASNNIIKSIQLTDFTRDSFKMTEYTYTSNNDLTSNSVYNYVNSIWQPAYRTTTIYDASGRKTIDSGYNWNDVTRQWMPTGRNVYNYGSNGMVSDLTQEYSPTPGNWKPTNRYLYTYSGALLTGRTYQSYSSGTWSDIFMYRNTYTNGLLDSAIVHYLAAGNLSPASMNVYHYNNQSLNDTVLALQKMGSTGGWSQSRKVIEYDSHKNAVAVIGQNFYVNVWANQYKTNYTYDSLDNNTKIDGQLWSGTAWFYDHAKNPIENYYYQTFDPVAVSSIKLPVANIKIYPLPASAGFINVNVDWKKPQPFTVTISDIQGRVIQHWEEQSCSSYTHTLSTTGLQAGNYILTLQGTKEGAAKQFMVQ